MTNKFRVGLVVGRFQPFHLGHKYLIEEALKAAEKIIIGIGSSNVSDTINPYSCEKRKKFLEVFIQHENIVDRVLKIVLIVDDPDDSVWLSKLRTATGKFDVGIGDNEWVNGIFENNSIPVVRVGFYKRDILEGKKIRKMISLNKNWGERVPHYLISKIQNS